MVTQAPVVLTFCADFRRTTLWAKERQATPGYDNFLSFINAATDALLYCQSFCNLAEAEGLGTCFLGTTVYQPDALIDALQLPRLVMPVATITLGWPDEHPALQDRLPIEAILHEEHYHDYTPASIDRCYAEKEEPGGEPRVCEDQPQGDAGSGLHRPTLYEEGQRGNV